MGFFFAGGRPSLSRQGPLHALNSHHTFLQFKKAKGKNDEDPKVGQALFKSPETPAAHIPSPPRALPSGLRVAHLRPPTEFL